jgi:hypothetical protein
MVCPYNRRDIRGKPARYCALNDFNAQIQADGGKWDETEILGNAALGKIKALPTTLATINSTVGFLRIPKHTDLTDTLGDLTVGERTAIINEALTLGYSQAEIDAALPANWQNVLLAQVLHFFAKRRRRARYDVPTDTIICDGQIDPVKPIEVVAGAVT